jgi:3-oxoacyl-[acyl-carrier protein] reductase
MVRAAVPLMRARGGGAILMSTSSSVKEPVQNLGLSTVLRASVSALAKTLALELGAGKDSRQSDHPGPNRHRSRPAPGRGEREESREFPSTMRRRER